MTSASRTIAAALCVVLGTLLLFISGVILLRYDRIVQNSIRKVSDCSWLHQSIR